MSPNSPISNIGITYDSDIDPMAINRPCRNQMLFPVRDQRERPFGLHRHQAGQPAGRCRHQEGDGQEEELLHRGASETRPRPVRPRQVGQDLGRVTSLYRSNQ